MRKSLNVVLAAAILVSVVPATGMAADKDAAVKAWASRCLATYSDAHKKTAKLHTDFTLTLPNNCGTLSLTTLSTRKPGVSAQGGTTESSQVYKFEAAVTGYRCYVSDTFDWDGSAVTNYENPPIHDFTGWGGFRQTGHSTSIQWKSQPWSMTVRGSTDVEMELAGIIWWSGTINQSYEIYGDGRWSSAWAN